MWCDVKHLWANSLVPPCFCLSCSQMFRCSCWTERRTDTFQFHCDLITHWRMRLTALFTQCWRLMVRLLGFVLNIQCLSPNRYFYNLYVYSSLFRTGHCEIHSSNILRYGSALAYALINITSLNLTLKLYRLSGCVGSVIQVILRV